VDTPLHFLVTSFPMLTEDQRQKAIEIAKQNETVKQYLEQGYEMPGISSIFSNISDGETAITMKIEGKTALAMALFVVAVFMLASKFMLPTNIQVIIGG